MTPREIADKLFDLQAQAEGIAGIVFAIYTAMESGPNSADSYQPGVWMVSNLIREHAEKLEALTDIVHPRASSKEGDAA